LDLEPKSTYDNDAAKGVLHVAQDGAFRPPYFEKKIDHIMRYQETIIDNIISGG
jgi:hypothetical protein